MIFGIRTGFALCTAALLGCAGGEPHPTLAEVEPLEAFSYRDIRLILTGTGFLPSFRLDPTSNQWVASMDGFSGRVGKDATWGPLTNFGWLGPTQISASLTALAAQNLQPGLCNIEITDPRGQKVTLKESFMEWGHDEVAPVLTIERPAPPHWPGSTIHMKVTATDQAPGHVKTLTWTAYSASATPLSPLQTGSCPVPPGSNGIDCSFDVVIDPIVSPNEQVCLVFYAEDDASNIGPEDQEPVCFDLIQIPVVAAVTPGSGGMAGGTSVVISGRGFPPGSQVFFGNDLLFPNGGNRADDTTISGYAPPHTASEQVHINELDVTCVCQEKCDLTYAASDSVPIKVKSLQGEAVSKSVFIYQSPPKVLCLDPASGLKGQDTPVSIYIANYAVSTMLYRGQTNLVEAVPLPLDPSKATVFYSGYAKVNVILPGSSGRSTIWAVDLANGWTSLPNGFSWNAR